MTELQMRHAELVEDHRANVARESENQRSNLAREAETARANRAHESLTTRQIVETERANQAKEGLSVATLDETHRANIENETIRKDSNEIQREELAETIRAHEAQEAEAHRANTEREADNARQTNIKYLAQQNDNVRLGLQSRESDASVALKKAEKELTETKDAATRWKELNDTSALSDAVYNEELRRGNIPDYLMSSVLGASSTIGKIVSGLTGLANIFGK